MRRPSIDLIFPIINVVTKWGMESHILQSNFDLRFKFVILNGILFAALSFINIVFHVPVNSV